MRVADDMQQLQPLYSSVNAKEKGRSASFGVEHSDGTREEAVRGKKNLLFFVQMLQKPFFWTVCGGGERTLLQCS